MNRAIAKACKGKLFQRKKLIDYKCELIKSAKTLSEKHIKLSL